MCFDPRSKFENGVRPIFKQPTNALILAIGHSARDTFALLNEEGFSMQQKPFSIGVRMEHPQREALTWRSQVSTVSLYHTFSANAIGLTFLFKLCKIRSKG